MITFDPTISFGSIVTALAFLVAGIGFVWAMRADIKVLATSIDFQGKRIEAVEQTMDSVTQILVNVAEQKQQLVMHEKLIDDLRRGEGMILPLKRGSREVP